MVTKVAVLDDYHDVALGMADWSRLADCAVTPFHDNLVDPDALGKRLAGFAVVCVMRERTPFGRAVFERLPDLKLLVTTGARNASIDLAAAADHGVTVCYTGGVQHPTAELAWGLILALARHIPREHEGMKAGGWQTTIGMDLDGATLGLLGLGKLGQQVATVGKAFNMNLIAWSQNLKPEDAAAHGVRRVEKDELFRQSDVISIHLVLGQRTRGLVGAREMGLMKPTSYLVNTSRGPIVDEAALLDALHTNRIAGAGLDVYDHEPLPAEHPLRRLPNVVLTPHLGYVTQRSYKVFFENIVEDIAAWLAGAPIRVLAPPSKA